MHSGRQKETKKTKPSPVMFILKIPKVKIQVTASQTAHVAIVLLNSLFIVFFRFVPCVKLSQGSEQRQAWKGRKLSQDGLVCFQIFLNGLDAVARMGDAHGVVPTQFVMHQQFAHHDYLKFRLRHVPMLAGDEDLLANRAGVLDFFHGPCCAFAFR